MHIIFAVLALFFGTLLPTAPTLTHLAHDLTIFIATRDHRIAQRSMHTLAALLPAHATAYQNGMQMMQQRLGVSSDEQVVIQLTGRRDMTARWLVGASVLLAAQRYTGNKLVAVVQRCCQNKKQVPRKKRRWGRRVIKAVIAIICVLLSIITGAARLLGKMLNKLLDLLKGLFVGRDTVPIAREVSEKAPAPVAADDAAPIAVIPPHRLEEPVAPPLVPDAAPAPADQLRGTCDIFPDNGPDPVDMMIEARPGMAQSLKAAWQWVWERREMIGTGMDVAYRGMQAYTMWQYLRPQASPNTTTQHTHEIHHHHPAPPPVEVMPLRGPLMPSPAPTPRNNAWLHAGMGILGGVVLCKAFEWVAKRWQQKEGAAPIEREKAPEAKAVEPPKPIPVAQPVRLPIAQPVLPAKQVTYHPPQYHVLPPGDDQVIRLNVPNVPPSPPPADLREQVDLFMAAATALNFLHKQDKYTVELLCEQVRDDTCAPTVDTASLYDKLARAYVLGMQATEQKSVAQQRAVEDFGNTCLILAQQLQRSQ